MKNNFGPLTVALAINSCAMNELQSSKKKGKISEKSKFRESFIEESIRSKLLAIFIFPFAFVYKHVQIFSLNFLHIALTMMNASTIFLDTFFQRKHRNLNLTRV